MALGPGSIAFVGFNGDGADNIAFVTLTDLAAGTAIQFTDDEWNGSAFNTGETQFTWTATNAIAAGTIVSLDNLSAGSAISNLGTVVYTETTNFGIGNNDETIYAFVGSTASPTFLAAIANGGFSATNGLLTGTGLTQGAQAINIGDLDDDADIGAFTGSRSGQADFSDYLTIINNTANWIVQDASGDQSGDTIAPDLPFSTTGFTTVPLQTVGFAPGSLSVSHNEGQSGTTDYVFTVERAGGATGDVNFSGVFASATTDNADYVGGQPVSFSGMILAGQVSGTVTIHVAGDVAFESNESFDLTLDTVSNSDAGVTVSLDANVAATGILLDDDIAAGVDLSTYVRIGRFDLPEPTRTTPPDGTSLLAQEASAVTYDWDTDTLFVVGDGGTSIVQVTKTGQLIDSMTLAPGGSPQGTEFYDPEGLTYVGGGMFVMTEERDRQAVQFTYAAGTTLTRGDAETVKLGTFVPNIGLEGVSYDPLTSGFIFVKETQPEGIFQTGIDFAAGTATNGSPTTDNSIDLFDPALAGLLDFADVYALSNLALLSGQADASHLLVLSQESGEIVNIDRSGNVYSSLTIVSDPGNPLSVAAQQHEGLTMDSAGNLYVVSENGGGDFDHPQLWVYAHSSVPNQAPTAVALNNQVTSIAENTSTTARIKVADVAIADDGLGTNHLSVTGSDASFFEVDSSGLYIKAGTTLDFEAKASYAVTVNVDDTTAGATPDATAPFTLTVTDVVNENPGQPVLYISEVAPWSSGNSPVGADWFEVTNTGSSAVDITGWKMDDNSDSFGSAVALNGITSIAAGESVIFIETTDLPGKSAAFLSNWFGASPPAGLHIGSYNGGGVGLSTGGDHVNLFNSSGVLQASVSFGASPGGPFPTFNNASGLNNTTISQLSAVGANGAFAAVNDANEIGSPGTIGKLFISEVAPWSSGNSPVGADWFEVTNSTPFAVDITGWKMDDNSGSPAAAVALNGITSIAAGESVIFIETSNLASARTAFINTWFGGNAPAGLHIGSYSGSGVGLSTGGDAVNLYNSSNVLQASVSFGASPGGPFPTFDNAAGLNNATISQLSAVGVNAAFAAVNDTTEIGSPGEITPVNDPPVAADDNLSDIAENSGDRTISFASLTGNDLAGPANESGQSLTIISVDNAMGGTVSIVGTDVIFAPALDYSGPASFDYTVEDNGTSYGLDNFLTDVGTVSFTITAVNEAPAFTSPASFSVAENHLNVGTVTALDPENDAFSFALSGGDDQAFFSIDPDTGALSFLVSPDFETPEDANHDNVYDLMVSATDSLGATSDQSVSVSVTDVAEAGHNLKGGNGNDVLAGTTGGDTMSGGNGNDQLDGGDGSDIISGGNGNDALSGGRANDVLDGGNGGDILNGGSGDDLLIGGNGNDNFDGGDGDDDLSGDNGNDIVNGGIGDDFLAGGNGNDQLDGGDGNDSLSGDNGNDVLTGGDGNNSLSGDDGNDSLAAGDGSDSLSGGAGKDILTGGNGADIFVFGPAKAADADRITDFSPGVDNLQFASADYGLPVGVLDAAHLVFGAAAADHHSEFIYNAAAKKLLWDADGIGGSAAVTVATFDTAVALTHTDFVLV